MDVRKWEPHEEAEVTDQVEGARPRRGSVVHDFNNLLAVILAYALMVEEEVSRAAAEDEKWEAVGRDVAQIKEAAEQATLLTRQLLAFARPEVVPPVDGHADPAPARLRILIVDDQDMVATTFRRLIEAAGMEVVGVAPTVQRGLALLIEQAPDVVVLDYLLPDGLGTEAVRRMLAAAPEVRVVMASGSDTLESREAAMQAGCVGYVDKAGAVRSLIPAIREAADGGASGAGGAQAAGA